MTGIDTRNEPRRAPSSAGGPLDPQHLLAGIEPELNQVIDRAVARVGEIEQTAVEQAQQVVARTEQEARDSYGSALERSAELVGRLEVLAAAVSDMSAALRAETDEVMRSLRGMRASLADWPQDAAPPAAPEPQPAAQAPAPEPAPTPDPAPETPEAGDPEVEPSEELIQLFREQITRMRQDGKSIEEAERVLLRFRLGHRFLGMLDEIYAADSRALDGGRKSGLIGKLRGRS